jgi:hypothetical protein
MAVTAAKKKHVDTLLLANYLLWLTFALRSLSSRHEFIVKARVNLQASLCRSFVAGATDLRCTERLKTAASAPPPGSTFRRTTSPTIAFCFLCCLGPGLGGSTVLSQPDPR